MTALSQETFREYVEMLQVGQMLAQMEKAGLVQRAYGGYALTALGYDRLEALDTDEALDPLLAEDELPPQVDLPVGQVGERIVIFTPEGAEHWQCTEDGWELFSRDVMSGADDWWTPSA